MKTILLALTMYAALVESSWAYLNPGTSSLLLQGLAASFAVVAGFVTLHWQRVKLFFQKLFKGGAPNNPEKQHIKDEQKL